MELSEIARRQNEANALWSVIFALNNAGDKVPTELRIMMVTMRDDLFKHGQENYPNNFDPDCD